MNEEDTLKTLLKHLLENRWKYFPYAKSNVEFDRENEEFKPWDHSDIPNWLENDEKEYKKTHTMGYHDSLFGLKQADCGKWYIGATAGGDWEYPVYYILYLREGIFEIYVPEGVPYYKPKMEAYGNNYGEEPNEDNIPEPDYELINSDVERKLLNHKIYKHWENFCKCGDCMCDKCQNYSGLLHRYFRKTLGLCSLCSDVIEWNIEYVLDKGVKKYNQEE